MGALLDTSVFIARERSRRLEEIPDDSSISVVTLAELQLGVLTAEAADERARRLATMVDVQRAYDAFDVDEDVALAYAGLIAGVRREGRRLRPFAGLIAATAIVHDLPLYSQDADFVGISGLQVVIV